MPLLRSRLLPRELPHAAVAGVGHRELPGPRSGDVGRRAERGLLRRVLVAGEAAVRGAGHDAAPHLDDVARSRHVAAQPVVPGIGEEHRAVQGGGESSRPVDLHLGARQQGPEVIRVAVEAARAGADDHAHRAVMGDLQQVVGRLRRRVQRPEHVPGHRDHVPAAREVDRVDESVEGHQADAARAVGDPQIVDGIGPHVAGGGERRGRRRPAVAARVRGAAGLAGAGDCLDGAVRAHAPDAPRRRVGDVHSTGRVHRDARWLSEQGRRRHATVSTGQRRAGAVLAGEARDPGGLAGARHLAHRPVVERHEQALVERAGRGPVGWREGGQRQRAGARAVAAQRADGFRTGPEAGGRAGAWDRWCRTLLGEQMPVASDRAHGTVLAARAHGDHRQIPPAPGPAAGRAPAHRPRPGRAPGATATGRRARAQPGSDCCPRRSTATRRTESPGRGGRQRS